MVDAFWVLNGVVYVVLLFATGQWLRIVPTSWEVVPNAISVVLQYLSLEWPVENSWVSYNDAQVLAVGGRMHSLEDITRFVELFLAEPFSDEERHVRRIGQLSHYESTGERPALPDSAKGLGPAEDQD